MRVVLTMKTPPPVNLPLVGVKGLVIGSRGKGEPHADGLFVTMADGSEADLSPLSGYWRIDIVPEESEA